MTRPNKHAARFGVRYRSKAHAGLRVGFSFRKFADAMTDAMTDALPAIHRITAGLRQVADNMRRAREFEATFRQVEAVFHGPGERWTYAPHTANMAAPTLAELEAGTPVDGLSWTELGHTGEDGIRPAWQPVDERPAFFHQPPAIGSTTGRIGGRFGPPADILDRIDDTLLTYDSQHADGNEPWPYRGF